MSVALDSYRALRGGGRLVMYGHYGTTIPATKILTRTSPGPGSGSGSSMTVITSGAP